MLRYTISAPTSGGKPRRFGRFDTMSSVKYSPSLSLSSQSSAMRRATWGKPSTSLRG